MLFCAMILGYMIINNMKMFKPLVVWRWLPYCNKDLGRPQLLC